MADGQTDDDVIIGDDRGLLSNEVSQFLASLKSLFANAKRLSFRSDFG